MRFFLTRGERAFIQRRRLKLSQKDMAARSGRSPRQQFLLEHETHAGGNMALKDHEQIALLRRRGGLDQDQMAQLLGCSRVWANRIERGQVADDLTKEALEKLKNERIAEMDHTESRRNTGRNRKGVVRSK